MRGPFSNHSLTDPQTDAEARIQRPLWVAARNTIAVLVPLGAAALFILMRYRALWDNVAWWVFAVVPAAAALGHAYLGAAIGGRRANNVFVIVLMVGLIVGCWALSRYDGSR